MFFLQRSDARTFNHLSSLVMDTNLGKPGANISTTLLKLEHDDWKLI